MYLKEAKKEKIMKKTFEERVEEMLCERTVSRKRQANYALQTSLRERTDEEVYEHIYRTLGLARQKATSVLS